MGIDPNHPDVLRMLAEGSAVDTTPNRTKRPTTPAGGRRRTVDQQPPAPPPSPWFNLKVGVPGLVTAGEANIRGKARAEVRRKREVKAAIAAALPTITPPPALPVVVTLTRVGTGTRPLDDDNLRRALKAVRDVVAGWLGADDADPRIRWRYRERRDYTPAVVIEVRTPGTRS
jgi:hypothetical protein